MDILHAAAALAVYRRAYLFSRGQLEMAGDDGFAPTPGQLAGYQAARKRYAVARCVYKALWNAETAHLRYRQP